MVRNGIIYFNNDLFGSRLLQLNPFWIMARFLSKRTSQRVANAGWTLGECPQGVGAGLIQRIDGAAQKNMHH